LRTRKDILDDLISLRKDVVSLSKELAAYPWDSNEPLVEMNKDDLRSVLHKCLQKDISTAELYEWANAVECRDDIDIADQLQELIFDLANAGINGEITPESISRMLDELQA